MRVNEAVWATALVKKDAASAGFVGSVLQLHAEDRPERAREVLETIMANHLYSADSLVTQGVEPAFSEVHIHELLRRAAAYARENDLGPDVIAHAERVADLFRMPGRENDGPET